MGKWNRIQKMPEKRSKQTKILEQDIINTVMLLQNPKAVTTAAAVCDYIFSPSKSHFSIVMTRMPKNESEMINFSYYCSLCIIKCGFNL